MILHIGDDVNGSCSIPIFQAILNLKPIQYAFRSLYTVFQKSDARIQITITTAYLIRIKYPLSGFNYHLSDVNIANFNKIHLTVSEQQLF